MANTNEDKKKNTRNGLIEDTRGLTTVEYIIILCLIAVVGFAVWKQFGQTIKEKISGADSGIGTLPTESGE